VARLLEPGAGGFLPTGKTARLAVSLAPRNGAPAAVKNARVQATVRRRTTGEQIFSKTLLDDGAEGDLKEGDGVFSRLATLPSVPMQLDVEIAAFVGDRALPPVVQPLETVEFPALLPLQLPDLSSTSTPMGTTISVPLATWRLLKGARFRRSTPMRWSGGLPTRPSAPPRVLGRSARRLPAWADAPAASGVTRHTALVGSYSTGMPRGRAQRYACRDPNSRHAHPSRAVTSLAVSSVRTAESRLILCERRPAPGARAT
jgi:hypothetical protein